MPTGPAESVRPRFDVRSRGFTLIEVLVALVIVAVSMTAAILVVTQRTRDGTYLRDKTVAHWIAMNLLTERRLAGEAPSIGKSSDSLEYAGAQWRWTIEVKQTDVETMRRLDVRVRPADAPEESALATVTGFYGTALSAAGSSRPAIWEGEPGGPGDDDDGAPTEDETPAEDEAPADDETSADGDTDADTEVPVEPVEPDTEPETTESTE